MYIDDQKTKKKNKVYRRVLLRNSYRVKGKVQHDTIANLTDCSDEDIATLKWALKNKKMITECENFVTHKTKQGLSIGSTWLLYQLAKRIGIAKVLGKSEEGKRALWMIIANVIGCGSRLSMVRLAKTHAACDILGLGEFNEDDLYFAMDWLHENQVRIEKELFKNRYGQEKPKLFLYDVTSSYLEGFCNELGDYGYSRDGKKGKKQIVIGLLTGDDGWPICSEVFRGNTQDPKTLKSQIDKMAHRFGVEKVTIVGDRGMIKMAQIDDITGADFHYITAITKAQIEKLMKSGVFQMSLFDGDLAEVLDGDVRYVLRRNPIRADEIEAGRQSKLLSLQLFVKKQMSYLEEHPKAKTIVARRRVNDKAKRLKIGNWVQCRKTGRTLRLEINEEKKEGQSKFDGCYVIKTDLSVEAVGKEIIHSRYKSLAEVEWSFRTMKTTFIELRGIFVRREERTRAHVFTVMLAYMIAYTLRRAWRNIEVTLEEGINALDQLCSLELIKAGKVSCQIIPEPRDDCNQLLTAAEITLPDAIPCRGVKVDTRKKLAATRRK